MSTPTDQPAPAVPVPFLSGTFALYQTPDGGIVVAYRAAGDEEDRRLTLPAHMVKLAQTLSQRGGKIGMMDLLTKFRS
jgi:hypothetical protein